MQKDLDALTAQREQLQTLLETLRSDQTKAQAEAAHEAQQKLGALQVQAEKWRLECKAAREDAEHAREEAEHARMLQQQLQCGSSTSSEWELLQAENEKLRRQVEMILLSREDTAPSSLGRSTEDLRRQPSSQSLEALTLAGVVPPMATADVQTGGDMGTSSGGGRGGDESKDEGLSKVIVDSCH